MEVIIIAAVCKNLGLGKDGKIPWKLSADLIRFRKITMGYPIIMGRKTFESLPSGPLEGRKNIVLSRSDAFKEGVFFVKSILEAIKECEGSSKVFVIGGAEIYSAFLKSGMVKKIMLTQIDAQYECDTYFPVFSGYNFKLVDWSPKNNFEGSNYQYLTYVAEKTPCNEANYLKLVQDIFDNGKERHDRTGTGTIAVFGRQMRFDLSNNTLPLLTTKFVGWRTVLKELLWFLRGDTNSKTLEKEGVNIWKGNSSREFLDSRGLQSYEEGDIGPMYFFQVFHYGAEYKGCNTNYDGCGYDQMKVLIDGLKLDPYSRRHMLTTYNPVEVDKSVLAPCHGIVIQYYVQDDDNGDKLLSCHMYQRSQDTFLGCPFNIASYSMLTHIIAARVGMKAHEVIISTGDTHIYKNHIDQMKKQLSRVPYPSPKFIVGDNVKEKEFKDITVEDFDVIGYFHHPPIRGEMAI